MKEFLNEIAKRHFTTIPYEELSQWYVGEAIIKDAVKFWESLGFLDGITNNTHKDILAVAYDNLTNDFLSENERLLTIEKKYNFNCRPDKDDNYNGVIGFEFNVVVFPILRRVICGVAGADNDGIGALFTYGKFLDYL